METLQVVISRNRVLIDQTWQISPDGLRIEEPGATKLQLERAQIRGFGLPRGRGGGNNYLVVAYQGAGGGVDCLRVPVLNGSFYGTSRARECYEALRRALPEFDLGWRVLWGPEFYGRLGVKISIRSVVSVVILGALAMAIAMGVLLLSLWWH